jgi:hypothetical protein
MDAKDLACGFRRNPQKSAPVRQPGLWRRDDRLPKMPQNDNTSADLRALPNKGYDTMPTQDASAPAPEDTCAIVAQPADGPDVAVFGDEGEPHVASRAKKLPLS